MRCQRCSQPEPESSRVQILLEDIDSLSRVVPLRPSLPAVCRMVIGDPSFCRKFSRLVASNISH